MNKKGFTLIELLVVISIVGILMTIITANLEKARTLARDRTRISDISSLQLALALYLNKFKAYPIGTSMSSLQSLVTNGYASSIPTDPLNTGVNQYSYGSDGNAYCLDAVLEKPNAYIDPSVSTFCNTFYPPPPFPGGPYNYFIVTK